LGFQALQLLQQILNERLSPNGFELLQLIEVTACSGKALGGKTRSRDAVVTVACRADLACGRAANDLHTGKQIPHFRGKNIEIEIDRAKEHYQRHILLHDPGVKLTHGIADISRARLSPSDVAIILHVSSIVDCRHR
jgi:hypothetical protein